MVVIGIGGTMNLLSDQNLFAAMYLLLLFCPLAAGYYVYRREGSNLLAPSSLDKKLFWSALVVFGVSAIFKSVVGWLPPLPELPGLIIDVPVRIVQNVALFVASALVA